VRPRLLFDENLSPKLAQLLHDQYPGSAHIGELGLAGATDLRIFLAAAGEGRMIVTNDSDFNALIAERGPPPKVLWLRIGNSRTAAVSTLLRRRAIEIARFAADADAGLLEIR
jgi:predicted nuclease of predicted toxin-antitoxin system